MNLPVRVPDHLVSFPAKPSRPGRLVAATACPGRHETPGTHRGRAPPVESTLQPAAPSPTRLRRSQPMSDTTTGTPKLDPRRTALLVMDYQRGILDRVEDPDGLVAKARQAIDTLRGSVTISTLCDAHDRDYRLFVLADAT